MKPIVNHKETEDQDLVKEFIKSNRYPQRDPDSGSHGEESLQIRRASLPRHDHPRL